MPVSEHDCISHPHNLLPKLLLRNPRAMESIRHTAWHAQRRHRRSSHCKAVVDVHVRHVRAAVVHVDAEVAVILVLAAGSRYEHCFAAVRSHWVVDLSHTGVHAGGCEEVQLGNARERRSAADNADLFISYLLTPEACFKYRG